jgi:PAS domain S-box-containing protein
VIRVAMNDISDRKQIDDAQQFLLQCGSRPTGEDFFESLARYLAQSLGMDFVCIDQLVGDGLAAKTVAIYDNGKFQDSVEYALKDTPCGDVVGKTICCFPKAVRQLFPRDAVLQKMMAESYVGTTLWSFDGRPIGLIAVIGRKPLASTRLAESVLKLVAVRAAGELERRRADESLRASEQLYRAIGESIDFGVWVCAPDGRNTYTSPSLLKLVGLTQEQCSDFGWGEVLHPDDAARTIAAWKECVRTGGKWDIEHRYRGVDGQWHPILARGVPVRNKQGEVLCWAGINLDTSRMKRAEEALRHVAEELERSNEDLQQFANVASHDLQEPLRMVSGFLKLLEDRYAPQLDDKANEYIGYSVEGATRMSQLITDLLAYSRVGSKGKELRPTDADKALAGAMANLRGSIQEAGATVTHEELPTVKADSTQVMQLFQNLIGNAIKFRSPDRPCQVHISAKQSEGQWVFAVRDNGIGIPPEQSERVFVIFQRLHGREKYPGTGIGLAICKKIVERHGGRIWVGSSPGEGSTFCFTIRTDGEQAT